MRRLSLSKATGRARFDSSLLAKITSQFAVARRREVSQVFAKHGSSTFAADTMEARI